MTRCNAECHLALSMWTLLGPFWLPFWLYFESSVWAFGKTAEHVVRVVNFGGWFGPCQTDSFYMS